MARMRYNHNSFSIGVLSKKVRGNTEFEGYNNGLDECVNFRIQHTGGCFKRGGTYFVAETRNSNSDLKEGETSEAILIPFVYSSEQSYVCEFGNYYPADATVAGYIRFFTIYGVVEKNGSALHAVLNDSGEPFEISIPFELEEIKKFKYFQNGNILTFVTDKGIYLLERKSASEFDFYPVKYTCEPMDFMNTDYLIKPKDEGTGHIGWDPETRAVVKFGIDASLSQARPDNFFSSLDVDHYLVLNYYHPQEGRKIYYLKITDVIVTPSQAGGGYIYYDLTVIIDVNLSPGSEEIKDGKTTGNIIYKLPTGDPVTKWQRAAFANNRNTPRAAAIFDGRMFLADGNKIWGSSVQDNDNLNFQLGVNQGDGVQFKLDMQNADEILWLASQSKLFVGTRGGIYLAGAASYNDEAISPSNFRVRLFEAVGASPLQPVMAMDSVFFVDSSGKNVHEIVLSGETGTFKAQDLSLLSSDLTQSGIIAHAWQQNPTKTYWCAVKDGYLCSLTYLKSNGVLAWAKHIIAGKNAKVESLVSMQGSEHDYLWMIVQREINGKTRRFIEYMHPQYEALDDEQFRQFYVDSGVVKEDKHIIKDIEISGNAHVTVDMSSVMNRYFGEFVVVFNAPSAAVGHPLATKKPFIAKNATIGGFDVYEDFRHYNNPNVKYGKIDPDLCGNSTIGVDVFVKVSSIPGFTSGPKTILQCDSQYLFNGDEVVVCNSDIGKGETKIDFNISGTVFKVYKNSNQEIHLLNLDGSYVESDDGPLSDRAELFKKVGGTGEFTAGTNTVIELEQIIDTGYSGDVFINKVVGTREINNTRYKVKKVTEVGKKIILCDYAASPSEDNLVVLDSSGFSAYDKSVKKNGNAYFYFSEVDGLGHLSDQKVSVCANGNIVTQIIDPGDLDEQRLISPVVKNGRIKLQHPAMFCAVGLPMKAWMKTLPFSGGSSLGSSVGSAGGQKSAILHLYYSLGGRYGSEKEKTYEIPYPSVMNKTYDKPADLYIGLIKAPVVNARDTTDRSLYIEHSEPLSFNILSITQDIQVSDA